ncbi:MAG: OmpA family protein [Rhizomicrobium sp.]
MRFDRLFGAAALAIVGAWSAGAAAPSDVGEGAIHLHMPDQTIHLHPIRQRAPQPTAPAQNGEAEPVASPEPSATVAPPRHIPPPTRAARKGSASRRPAIPFSFGDEGTTAPSGVGAVPQPAPPVRTAALPPHPGTPAPVSAARAAHTDLTKRGAVLFSKGAPDPSPAQFSGVKLLAGDLATALESGGARVELDAYGGAPGDKSSDARRLSLRRALAVRQLLIDDGVPSSRIDVRALGGAQDKGPADRVDVFVRAG